MEQQHYQKYILLNILFNVMIIVGLYLFYLIINLYSLQDDMGIMTITSEVLAFFSIFLTIYYVYLWDKVTKIRFNLFSMLLISFLLFTMGQSILFAIGISPKLNLFLREPIYNIVKAEFYTIICYVSFFIGGLIFLYRKKNINSKKTSLEDKKIYSDVFRKVGLVLFIVTVLPTFYYLLNQIQVSNSIGYSELKHSSYTPSILIRLSMYMADYFVASLILLMIGYKNNKYVLNLINFIAVVVSILYFLWGERGIPASILLLLLWFKSNLTDRSSAKSNLKLLVGVLVLIIAFPIIGEIRNADDLSILLASNYLSGGENLIIDTVANFGYSMFPLIKTMELVPEVTHYKFGTSYLFALTTIIPNLFGGTHIGAQHSALAQWLMNTLGMSSGPGFSIPAEAYYNFGWFPVPIMILLGLFFSKMLTIKINEKDNYVKMFAILLFFYFTVTSPRAQFMGIVRDIFYYIVPISLVIILIVNELKNKYKRMTFR